MRSILGIVTALAWGLWLGGLVALFIFVLVLFRQDKALAVEAAPRMFAAFEHYQLLLAAVAVIVTGVWRMIDRRAVLAWLFALFALATIGAVIEPVFITGPMQRLR